MKATMTNVTNIKIGRYFIVILEKDKVGVVKYFLYFFYYQVIIIWLFYYWLSALCANDVVHEWNVQSKKQNMDTYLANQIKPGISNIQIIAYMCNTLHVI